MSALPQEIAIHCSVVNQEKRLDFLPYHLGDWAIKFENETFSWADSLCLNYTGGYWEFYSLNNGGFFIAPDMESDVEMFVSGNGFSGKISSEAAGIITTLFSLGSLAFDHYEISDIFSIKYHQLRDYAKTHPESVAILSAID